MADATQIALLRKMIDEGDSTSYTDEQLTAVLDQAEGELNIAASEIWQQKAAQYSTLVDVSESGSSRHMSQLAKNALAMAAHYRAAIKDQEVEEAAEVRPRTRTAVRK